MPTRFTSAMPSSMWRPWSDSRQRTSVSVSSANQSMRSPRLQMPILLIQPPRLVDVPTSGETVTTRSATSGASRARSTKKRPNACWVDSRPVCRRARAGGRRGGWGAGVGRDAGRRRGARRLPAQAGGSGRAQLRLRTAGGERPPRVLAVLVQLLGERAVLVLGEQRGVVGGVALGGQRPALDRVGEDDGGPVAHLVGLAVAVDQRREVVPAEVAEGGEQVGVGEVGDVDLEALAQLRRIGAQEALVLLVGHRVDAGAQRGPALEARA